MTHTKAVVTMYALRFNEADNPNSGGEQATDLLFHAFADATRRDILRRCGQGEVSVSRLADAYPMSFAAVQKHVAVLERAGLVTKERRGREHLVHTEFETVHRARIALDALEQTWRGRVDRMSALLSQLPEPDVPTTAGEEVQ